MVLGVPLALPFRQRPGIRSGAPAPTHFLDPAVGTVSTPDAPELTIQGDVRIVARVRDDSAEAAVARNIADRIAIPGDATWRLSTFSNGFFLQGSVDGTAFVPGVGVATRAQVGLTPSGVDRFVGGQVVTGVEVRALTSADGVAWTVVGAPLAVAANVFQRESLSPVRVGVTWQGRIYMAQMETLDGAGNPTGLVWRFDAADYPGSGLSYVDPRGRTWNLSAPGAIVPVP